jgi:hypothetical protein
MTTRTYVSPEAFKQALEQRLRSSAKTGAELTTTTLRSRTMECSTRDSASAPTAS